MRPIMILAAAALGGLLAASSTSKAHAVGYTFTDLNVPGSQPGRQPDNYIACNRRDHSGRGRRPLRLFSNASCGQPDEGADPTFQSERLGRVSAVLQHAPVAFSALCGGAKHKRRSWPEPQIRQLKVANAVRAPTSLLCHRR